MKVVFLRDFLKSVDMSIFMVFKVKNQEFKKTHEFLEVLYFSLFCQFTPKVAWGATLQRENIREIRLCQNWIFEVCPGSQPASQPAGQPAGLLASSS